jgi:TDG/mug DNA glycosylase family protein
MAVLPDVLQPGLKVVFCGTAAGDKSAEVQAYYAGRGNQFWPVLARIGLTPRQLSPHEYRLLVDYGIGLTDLAKAHSGIDSRIPKQGYDKVTLQTKIRANGPQILAFNGKRAAQEYLGHAVDYGLQRERIGQTMLFILPSSSGAARGCWDQKYWRQLSSLVKILEAVRTKNTGGS